MIMQLRTLGERPIIGKEEQKYTSGIKYTSVQHCTNLSNIKVGRRTERKVKRKEEKGFESQAVQKMPQINGS